MKASGQKKERSFEKEKIYTPKAKKKHKKSPKGEKEWFRKEISINSWSVILSSLNQFCWLNFMFNYSKHSAWLRQRATLSCQHHLH